MNAINSVTTSNINQNPYPSNPNSFSNKLNHLFSNLNYETGKTTVPGIGNIISAPYELYKNIQAIYAAHCIGDEEGFIESGLKITQAPINFCNSALQISYYVIYIGVFFQIIKSWHSTVVLPPLSSAISYTGFILTGIEGVLESIDLGNTIHFIHSHSLLKSNPEQTHSEQLKKIQQTYFEISSEDRKKIDAYVESKKAPNVLKQKIIEFRIARSKNTLTQLIHPQLVKRIEEFLGKATGDEKMAESILKEMQTQMQKKILVHSVGLLAVITTIIGLTLGCIACPIAIPFVFMVVGIVLAWTRYFLYYGLLDSEGWAFSIENCIPAIFKRNTTETQVQDKVKALKFEPLSSGSNPFPSQISFISPKEPAKSITWKDHGWYPTYHPSHPLGKAQARLLRQLQFPCSPSINKAGILFSTEK